MKIKNFEHKENQITFDIEKNNVINKVVIEKTDTGTTSTPIEDFTENWNEQEYTQLEDFIESCSGLIHCYYH